MQNTTDISVGIIISSYGDSFKVVYGGEEYICRARGALRNKSVCPFCGDRVELEFLDGEAVISEILPRKNEIIRPPLSNLDQLVFVTSTVEPKPNILNLDKFLAVAVYKGISPVLVFTKTDKSPAGDLCEIYKGIFPTFEVDNTTGSGVEELSKALEGKFSALAGNSGVGKSSLLNNLCPGIEAKTAEISRKLGRGRHTTRRTVIYPLPLGGYIADTPGFAAFSTDRYDVIMKDDLASCFPEFEPYIGTCRFSDCSHTKEQGCEILAALRNNKIRKSRHASYVEMYVEAEKIKSWKLK